MFVAFVEGKIMNRKVLIVTTILFLVFSCGGVIGNIEKYQFDNISTNELNAALERVYAKHPELVKREPQCME